MMAAPMHADRKERRIIEKDSRFSDLLCMKTPVEFERIVYSDWRRRAGPDPHIAGNERLTSPPRRGSAEKHKKFPFSFHVAGARSPGPSPRICSLTFFPS